jgi:4-amino-4-deoxy-L-arabinose transferase-like glycosyltransferase
MSVSPRARFLLICCLAALPRLAFVLYYGPNAAPSSWGDDWHYDRIARQIVSAHAYSDGWFPPGYPLFLAGIYSVFGAHVAAVRFVQVALGAATCGIVYLLGRRLYDERVGVVAALLLAFYPPHIYFTWRIMAETTFALLLAVSAWLAIQLLTTPRWSRGVALGITLGFGNLLKSNLILLPPLLLVWLAVMLRGRSALKVLIAASMSFLLVSGIVQLGNFAAGNGLAAPLPMNAGHTLWWANNPKASGYFEVSESDPSVQAFIRDEGFSAALSASSRPARDRIYQRLALIWVRKHPIQFLALAPLKLANAFSPLPKAAILESGRSASVVYALSYGLLLPFACYGLALSIRRATPAIRVMHLILVSYVVMVIIFYGTPRFTLIVMPYLTIFSAHGLIAAASLTRWTRAEAGMQRSWA